MKKEEIFNSLVQNALDFLFTSVEDLESRPKYSVINFYTGVELFLKARLMQEHWSLVLMKPETANLNRFIAGDFQSVGVDEAIKRLEAIVEQKIFSEEKKCFKTLQDHRNKLMHFFHHNYADEKNNKEIIEKIVSEQCKGWMYLHDLLTNPWKDIFQAHLHHITRINNKIHRNLRFLKNKFETLEPSIRRLEARGVKYHNCVFCEYKSGFELQISSEWYKYECLVCEAKIEHLSLPCPKCKTNIFYVPLVFADCKKCQYKLVENDVINFFNKKAENSSVQIGIGQSGAYCNACEYGTPSVFPFEKSWLCVVCFTPQSQPENCHHCKSYVTGPTEFVGCYRCEQSFFENVNRGLGT